MKNITKYQTFLTNWIEAKMLLEILNQSEEDKAKGYVYFKDDLLGFLD